MGGAVTVSVDFELRWGMHDRLGLDADLYRDNLEQVPAIVPELLRLFTQYGVHATWATVGAILCNGWDDYFARAPAPPRYRNSRLAVDVRYSEMDPDGHLHFAPSLVQAISGCRGQDLGTHTFSHLFLGEPGVTPQDASADIASAMRIHLERTGEAPVSLVFPRNQWAFLDVMRSHGIRLWRGTERSWYFRRTDSHSRSAVIRALQLLDGLNPWTAHTAPVEGDMTRSSLFLRVGLPDAAWKATLRKIRRALLLLRDGEVFHLWLHPHNFGTERAKRLARLEQALEIIATSAALRGLSLRSMRELAG